MGQPETENLTGTEKLGAIAHVLTTLAVLNDHNPWRRGQPRLPLQGQLQLHDSDACHFKVGDCARRARPGRSHEEAAQELSAEDLCVPQSAIGCRRGSDRVCKRPMVL